MKVIFKPLAAVSLLFFLSACATTSSELEPEDLLQDRAQARWDALVARDFETAYEYLTPGYKQQQTVVNYAVSMSGRPVIWTSGNVREVVCENEQKCTVRTDVGYRIPGGPTGINNMRMSRVIDETWLKLAGEWWYSPD